MTTVAEVLAAFDAAVAAHGIGEQTKNFAAERLCLALIKTATATQQLALSEAANTADRLARKLETSCGDIRAEDEEYWRECGSRLRAMIEMGGSQLSAGEIAPARPPLTRYTQSNGRFAMTVEPDNPELVKRMVAIDEARAHGRPTVPTTIEAELCTNPFMRAESLMEFTSRRVAKDNFRG